ncbi:dihydroorotate dehydrogenase [Nonomuraea angiospora]|uniref:dihydroorotate dehydrogenase n=1 Tax=Nonomuraea angiospora TaxID=46172 RepID=UPI0029B568D1|nr:dihydroorotate dehydrogenase [Nonomuraea angiospora]MDX3107934.1 dihydroorotate dehydrogenase [Nonomuraea angiospora]
MDLTANLSGLKLANPVMPASGCFGPELDALLPVRDLGAVVTKTVFTDRRSGNPAHRLTETEHGMLNSVGIPSPGTAHFTSEVLDGYRAFGVPVVASVGGLTVEEYWRMVEELDAERIDALEVNVSCPNLEHGGLAIGTDPAVVERLVTGVADRANVPVFVKLTPNVTSIGDIARAAEFAGAAGVTVCNTFPGLAIDVYSRRPVLGNAIGGLSGPAIKPLALRLVWQAGTAVDIPVIGCGGIRTARDVVEFLLAGATAVQVGTATFARPYVMSELVRGLAELCAELGVTTSAELVGGLL